MLFLGRGFPIVPLKKTFLPTPLSSPAPTLIICTVLNRDVEAEAL